MIVELLYTSAAQGLKQGSRGFCTVMASTGLPINLAQRLEAISGYRHIFPAGDAQSDQNPVNYSHIKLPVAGRTFSILSRISAYGVDYSQRTNKLAHHIAIDAQLPTGGPIPQLRDASLIRSQWDGTCRTIPTSPRLSEHTTTPEPCATWKSLTGDAGWAGPLIDAWQIRNSKPIWIIFSAAQSPQMLRLIEEAIAILPESLRWQATFSTYFSSLPPDADCKVRCVVQGSDEARMAVARGTVIDLTKPLLAPPETAGALAARAGTVIGQSSPRQIEPETQEIDGLELYEEEDEDELQVKEYELASQSAPSSATAPSSSTSGYAVKPSELTPPKLPKKPRGKPALPKQSKKKTPTSPNGFLIATGFFLGALAVMFGIYFVAIAMSETAAVIAEAERHVPEQSEETSPAHDNAPTKPPEDTQEISNKVDNEEVVPEDHVNTESAVGDTNDAPAPSFPIVESPEMDPIKAEVEWSDLDSQTWFEQDFYFAKRGLSVKYPVELQDDPNVKLTAMWHLGDSNAPPIVQHITRGQTIKLDADRMEYAGTIRLALKPSEQHVTIDPIEISPAPPVVLVIPFADEKYPFPLDVAASSQLANKGVIANLCVPLELKTTTRVGVPNDTSHNKRTLSLKFSDIKSAPKSNSASDEFFRLLPERISLLDDRALSMYTRSQTDQLISADLTNKIQKQQNELEELRFKLNAAIDHFQSEIAPLRETQLLLIRENELVVPSRRRDAVWYSEFVKNLTEVELRWERATKLKSPADSDLTTEQIALLADSLVKSVQPKQLDIDLLLKRFPDALPDERILQQAKDIRSKYESLLQKTDQYFKTPIQDKITISFEVDGKAEKFEFPLLVVSARGANKILPQR